MFDRLDDTIVAVSSPPGQGARGILRLSGPNATAIAAVLFQHDAAPAVPKRSGFRRLRGDIVVEGDLRAPAEAYFFRAPRSYTRQDLVELHTIGAPPLLAMILDAAVSLGARLAEPGEFTARAFLSGAMDLAQAESVAASIRAQSDAQLRGARQLAEGALAKRTAGWMAELVEITALVEADIDFAEEPIEFVSPRELRRRLTDLGREIDELVRSTESAERFDVLPRVLLIGPANAGKSSLMNALCGMDRAICSAVAGTTRDILTAPLSLPGLDCLLLDGAGLTRSDDELIQAAQTMTRATAARVDLLCLVVDASTPIHEDAFAVLRHHPDQPALIALNKTDLVDPVAIESMYRDIEARGFGPTVASSAVTGAGLESLKALVFDRLGASPVGEDRAMAVTARQRRALKTASEALGRAIQEAGAIGETIDRADIIALELREALDAVGSVCGSVTTEDLLSEVFANFCIGK